MARISNRTFTRVKNLETEKEGAVEDRLSKQFTVQYDDNTFGFLFYDDKGVVWEPLDEKKMTTRSAFTVSNDKAFATDFAKVFDDAVMLDILKAHAFKEGV